MCGITGLVNLDKKPVDKKVLTKMTRVLSHRGPDGEGFYVAKNIGLGHRRLSIIDLSPLGHQPMFYDNRNLVIVYNGEIYNYLEIREELSSLGYKFKSQSDTEVILASYKEWGTDCLSRFNGMWAFAIYDCKKRTIFAARDRLGIKPFYYHFNKRRFAFASEMKAILELPDFPRKANERIVWDYLIGGLVDHREDTFFEGIKELRGGYYLKLKIDHCKLKIKQYWDVDVNRITTFTKEEEYAERFRELFTDSVRLRLRSDVPIGSCLSGGLDSSLIVSVVNDFLKKEGKIDQIGIWQQTFSACYDRKKYQGCDERSFIEQVIKKTRAKSHYVFPEGQTLLKEIEKLTYHQDTPFASTSIYAQWNVFRLASQHKIKVMLDGQGADELLSGYHGYFNVYFAQLAREMRFFRLALEFYQYSRNHFSSWSTPFKIVVQGAMRGYLGKYIKSFAQKAWSEYDLFKDDFRNKYSYPPLKKVSDDLFRNALYNLLKTSLSSLLKYEDRDSMAFSIEARVPFLDYRLVEYVFSLPNNQKIRHGTTKWVMREATKGILPEKIRTRQDKIGFNTPEDTWFKEDLHQKMREIFSSESFKNRGFYEPDLVIEKFDDYLSGKIQNYQLFWRLFNLEIWYRLFID